LQKSVALNPTWVNFKSRRDTTFLRLRRPEAWFRQGAPFLTDLGREPSELSAGESERSQKSCDE